MRKIIGRRRRLGLAILLAALCWFSTAEAVSARPGHVATATIQSLNSFKLYRMVYLSTGLSGEPIRVSGLVVVPNGPVPKGGRPIVAWAHPTTGVEPQCAPSLQPDVLGKIPGLEAMLARGYIVAATDYPGLGTNYPHPYLVGLSEGRAVLDSVRATRDLLGPVASRRFIVWGHSQGGHAALFTGQLARAYAPELQLEGVAVAAPATELAALFTTDISTVQGKVLTSLTLWSWSRVYGIPLGPVAGQEQIADIDRIAGICLGNVEDEVELFLAARTLQKSFLKVDDLTKISPWRGLIARNTPTGSSIRVPLFVAQGTADTIVEPVVTENFFGKLCRNGKRAFLYLVPGITHDGISRISAPAAVEWMAARFAHTPAPSNCDGIATARRTSSNN